MESSSSGRMFGYVYIRGGPSSRRPLLHRARRCSARYTLSMSDDDRRVTYFGATHTRGNRDMFGIRAEDRSKHIYVIGKTGMGKSTMLENMAIQDIQNGEGIAFKIGRA